MKKIIVFGATGNLGAYIAMHMKSKGYDVVAVGGRKDDHNFFADHGMRYYSVNIKDRRAFDVLPKEDYYAVAHFASSLPSRYAFDPVDLVESITIGTLNVLEWMREVGCKKIVFPQTPSATGGYLYASQPTNSSTPSSSRNSCQNSASQLSGLQCLV